MSPKPRKVKELLRREEYKNAGRRILIICEGEKTEPQYFIGLRRELNLPAIKIDILPSDGSAPISVVDFAIEKREKAAENNIETEYDEIWCVMDVDQHGSLERALRKAKDKKISVALSNPCFEYWYLLHFEQTNSRMTGAEARRKLKVHIPQYKKNDPDNFKLLFPNMHIAIKRSKDIFRGLPGEIKDCNSSTNVHQLVELLIKISKS